MQYLHFLLVPDSSAARRVRRAIVETGARNGVVVGTWPELVGYACRSYLLAPIKNNWDEQFQTALGAMTDAFWAKSFLVSPQETAAAIEASYIQIVSASDLNDGPAIPKSGNLPKRTHQHYADLIELHNVLDGKLPSELIAVRELIKAEATDAIQRLLIYQVDDVPTLSQWQSLLIKKLNGDANTPLDAQLAATLSGILTSTEKTQSTHSLATLQTHLFSPSVGKAVLDKSIQWVGARDFLEEAEVATGLVQMMLAEHPGLQAADIGLLLPENFEYSIAVNDAFTLAGLTLSGLPAEGWQRDLGREVVFHFLYCRQKPAPAMALAVCLSSPLMPWSREEGAVLAQKVMDGRYELRPLSSFNKNARTMLDLIREGDEGPNTLLSAVQSFVSLLDGNGDKFTGHIQHAKIAAESICATLEGASDVDWVNLRRTVSPKYIKTGESPDFNLEGVTVWREGHEPWREVQHLIVLGFAEGNYPASLGSSPVFVTDDLIALRESLVLGIHTLDDELMFRRARFKRQLGTVSDSVSFLVPRRNPSGESQAPSESIVFMHQLFDTSSESPEDLIMELDAAADRVHVRYLAQAKPGQPILPRVITANDICFEQDLLALRKDHKGQQKPESPSSLDMLMVSRLAWLLNRLNAIPLGWAPESPNVLLNGTLAHQVFEELFQKDAPIPEKDIISKRVELLLNNAIKQHGPFLRAPQWQVERHHLATGIIEAARAWRDVLQELGAEVLGCEEWLEGSFNGIPIHGQADLILGLPNNRLLIVDYKRSSAMSRRPRMQKGYDSQANLYRIMLETGGIKDKKNTELSDRISKASRTGIVYYMLNDQTALSDTVLAESGEIPHWEALEGDISGHALQLIERRLREMQDGMLCLNREGDAVFFEKQAGVKPYALEDTPLIQLFTIPGEAEEIE